MNKPRASAEHRSSPENLPAPAQEKNLGMLLLESGKVTQQDLETIEHSQRSLGLKFGEVAVRLGFVTEAEVNRLVAMQFDYPYVQPGEGNFSPELIAAYQPFSRQVEAFRNLRAQLKLRWFNHGQRLLMIFGAGRGQGCSYLAANLAVVFSQLGERTLLIDADLRRPRQHKIFSLVGRQGLSDLLAGRGNGIEKIPGFVDLSVLQAGTLAPNPQELLGRPAFPQFLKEFAAAYDVVLLDTPSGDYSADIQHIAAVAGAGLLVTRNHQTRLRDAQAIKEKVTDVNARIVGAVLNDF